MSRKAMKRIKTWYERCEEHPNHQHGMVSKSMIQARMQEEIDELRQALETKREWVGLTDEECIKSMPRMPYEYEFNVQALLEYTKNVEAKLKEKNQ